MKIHNRFQAIIQEDYSHNLKTSWYLGIRDYETFRQVVSSHSHVALLDVEERSHINSCLNVERIPSQYKSTQTYYAELVSSEMSKYLQQNDDAIQLEESHVLRKDTKLADAVRRVFSADISPLFARQEDLVDLPSAYMIVLEWDPLKDEGFLYAERLKEAGVPVHVAFYEKAFHGSALLTSSLAVARQMQADLVDYIKVNI